MAIEWDPILFVNLVLCIIIVLLGIICYRRSHESLPLFIAAAFGLFGISHAATLLGYRVPLTVPLIIIRALAYLLVVYALVMHLKTTMIAQDTRQAWVDFFREESGQPVSEGEGQEHKK
jgi:CHASE2 domain-containing sensor protein